MDIFIGIVLLDENDQIYLIKEEDKNQISAERWNLPGGGINENEGLTQATVRESKEETGYDVKLTSLLGVYKAKNDDKNWFYFVFGGLKRGEQETVTDTDVKEGKWFSKDEFLDIDESKLVHPDMKKVYKVLIENGGLPIETVKTISYTT